MHHLIIIEIGKSETRNSLYSVIAFRGDMARISCWPNYKASIFNKKCESYYFLNSQPSFFDNRFSQIYLHQKCQYLLFYPQCKWPDSAYVSSSLVYSTICTTHKWTMAKCTGATREKIDRNVKTKLRSPNSSVIWNCCMKMPSKIKASDMEKPGKLRWRYPYVSWLY